MSGHLALVIALTAFGCSGKQVDRAPEQANEPKAPQAAELKLDEPISLEDGRLELTWLHVSDSRCPRGVNCIWAGEVRLTLEVKEGDAEPLELTIGRPEREDDVSRSAHHSFHVESVEPYPDHGKKANRADLRAVVTVTPAE